MNLLYNKNIAEYLFSNSEAIVYTPNILDSIIASGALKSKFGFDVHILNNIYGESISGAICIRISKKFADLKNCLIIDIENSSSNSDDDNYYVIDTNKLSVTSLIAELFGINMPEIIIRNVDKVTSFDLKTKTSFEFLVSFFMEWHKLKNNKFFKFASEHNWTQLLASVKALYSQFVELDASVKIHFHPIFKSNEITAYDLKIEPEFKDIEYLPELCAIKSIEECTFSDVNVIFYEDVLEDSNNILNMFLCARELKLQLKLITELKQFFLANVITLPNLSILKLSNTENNTTLKKKILYKIQKLNLQKK